MRITTERRDAFDRLAALARRLPGGRGLEKRLIRYPALRRWLWFGVIYLVSILVFATAAYLLDAIVPK